MQNENHKYLLILIPTRRFLYSNQNIHKIPILNAKYNFIKNSFFPLTIIERNKLDPHLKKYERISVFKGNILKFIRSSPNSVYNCHNPKRDCLIARTGLNLREHKFKHGFQNTLNPLRGCGNDVELTQKLLLHCLKFVIEKHSPG